MWQLGQLATLFRLHASQPSELSQPAQPISLRLLACPCWPHCDGSARRTADHVLLRTRSRTRRGRGERGEGGGQSSGGRAKNKGRRSGLRSEGSRGGWQVCCRSKRQICRRAHEHALTRSSAVERDRIDQCRLQRRSCCQHRLDPVAAEEAAAASICALPRSAGAPAASLSPRLEPIDGSSGSFTLRAVACTRHADPADRSSGSHSRSD